ncbi:hypothetical protein, partial [Neisseria sicca]|uniref:hypothetical protein n=1 Tax=Neisseria sicca TaxID=490 RepID=UPI003C73D483
LGAKTAENLFLGFGYRGKGFFAKVSGYENRREQYGLMCFRRPRILKKHSGLTLIRHSFLRLALI